MPIGKYKVDTKYIDFIENAGISLTEVLIKAGLPEHIYNDEALFVSIDEYIKLMENLKEVSKDKYLPIKIGTAENGETFSPPIFAAYCSKNALVCMNKIACYKKLVAPFKLSINENEENDNGNAFRKRRI